MYFLSESRFKICLNTGFRASTEADTSFPLVVEPLYPKVGGSQDDSQEFSSWLGKDLNEEPNQQSMGKHASVHSPFNP